MWRTFIAEFKHIFSKKIRAIEWIVMLFIPFIYGFLYMNAYWTPFKKVDQLNVVVVNNDIGNSNENYGNVLTNALESVDIKGGALEFNIRTKDVSNIYSGDDSKAKIEEAVNSGKYSAGIVIPKNFTSNIDKFKVDSGLSTISNEIEKLTDDKMKNELYQAMESGDYEQLLTSFPSIKSLVTEIQKIDAAKILKSFINIFGTNSTTGDENKLHFYNDYKNNYLAGEMTNFGAGLKDLIIKSSLSSIVDSHLMELIQSGFRTLSDESNIVTFNSPDSRISNPEENFGYGVGLSPYFLSIGLWAGVLVMTFMIKNERYIKTESTLKHYFGKWAVWVLTGFIQATILLTAVTIQGVNLGIDQWQLYAFSYFTVIIFASIVQGVAYSIRFGDIGEFVVVILLVLQLISSSGTFPVEMQSTIFKVIHPVVPFTYSIQAFRELIFQPDIVQLFTNIGWMLLFPLVTIPIGLFINWRYDKKTVTQFKGLNLYKSFEIHVGDL